jgi:hypothetical protein
LIKWIINYELGEMGRNSSPVVEQPYSPSTFIEKIWIHKRKSKFG